VVGFEVEPKSIDSQRIVVNQDGTCSIKAGDQLQKINRQGLFRSIERQRKNK